MIRNSINKLLPIFLSPVSLANRLWTIIIGIKVTWAKLLFIHCEIRVSRTFAMSTLSLLKPDLCPYNGLTQITVPSCFNR